MNVLIIGLGSIARKHLDALSHIDGGEHMVWALRSSADAPEVEGVSSITSLDQLPPDAAISFVIISNPTSAHADTLKRVMTLGVPVMIEKPVFEQARYHDLVSQLASRGLLTYVACNLRFLGCLQFVKEYLATNRPTVNEVNAYCGSSLPSWRPGTDWRQCYSANASMGGGVHLDLIHELDYVAWMFGMPQRSHSVCRSVSTLGIDAVDYANYCLEYPTFCASVVLNYFRPEYRRTLEIVTDTDILTANLATNTVTDMNGNILYENASEGIADTYKAQMRYFTDLVKQGATWSFNSVEWAYDLLKIANDYIV